MNFETGLENNTDSAGEHADDESAECTGCAPDPDALGTFKRAIRTLGGKWKLEILFALMNGAARFGALRRSVDGITQHMLTAQLRELKQDGLVLRTAFAEKPLRVEYNAGGIQIERRSLGLAADLQGVVELVEDLRPGAHGLSKVPPQHSSRAACYEKKKRPRLKSRMTRQTSASRDRRRPASKREATPYSSR
jgi:DNA-binding HxlR family transcriptional regulator